LTMGGTNAVVSLGGVATLQTTTGGYANGNIYLLVPAVSSGPPVRIAVSSSGGNLQLSFQTQTGHNYAVKYKNSLTDAAWTLLATYSGDGTLQTHVVGPATGAARFYIVVTQ